MITVRDVMEVMEKWAPSSLAESWDNPGLLTGDPDDPVRTVLITLDVTEESLEAAIDATASLIISHHPPIFKPLSSLSGSSLSARVIRKAVCRGISLFTAHTNLDKVPGGVSHAAAESLGVKVFSPLVPGRSDMVKFVTFSPPAHTNSIREAAGAAGAGIIGEYSLCSFTARGTGTYIPSSSSRPFSGESSRLSREKEDRIEMIAPAALIERVVNAVRNVHPYEEMAYDVIPLSHSRSPFGYGVIGELATPMDSSTFACHVARSLGVETLSISGNDGRAIHKAAVMGGSGGSFIRDAVARGADAYITGDLGYHDFLEADGSILLIDATHRATELPVLRAVERRLAASLSPELVLVVYHGTAVQAAMHYSFSAPHNGRSEDWYEGRSHETPGGSGG